jgi:hypothetical protein
MAMRDSGGEALHRRLDSGRVGTELHAVLKARQWVGAASLINESSARFKQWGRLPLHWAAAKNAPLHIIESLLVAYPGAARVQDSCPQVPPAELAKKASIRGTIRDCAADPVGWRARIASDCVDGGDRAQHERDWHAALVRYRHGHRVVPSHSRLRAGVTKTQQLQVCEL